MRKLSYLFMVLSALCSPCLPSRRAEEPARLNWVAITAGFSMAFASGICGLAQGKATAAATEDWPAIPRPVLASSSR